MPGTADLSSSRRVARIRRQARRQEFLSRKTTRLWGELLEPRLMMAVDTPDIVVGRTLSAYSIADVQNNELKVTYTVYNQEAEDVSGVLLTTTLQTGVTFTDATQLPDQNGQELAWSLGTIPAYGRASVEVTVELANNTVLTIDDGAEAFSTLNARASSDSAPPAALKANPLPAALLASTIDANTTDPFIQEQAARLDYDPQHIIDFLQAEIGYESYVGSLRGARGTLWSNAGNALDEASLGVALFRASGIPAQYASGTLSDPIAQQLILSMFPESYQSVGYIPPGTELADPASDPQLLVETREHYWVQFDTGAGLQNIDTTFANAVVSQVFGTPTCTFTEVADALRHKVSVAVVAETYYPGFAGLIGALNQLSGATSIPGTSEQVVLNRTFASAALVGHPLTFGHFTETEPVDALFSPSITTFSPYLIFGDDATPNGLVDDVVTGADYQEILSGFPLANALVSGQFIDLTITSPTGEVEKTRRTMADRFGAAVRAGGVSTTLSLGADSLPLSSPYDLTTISLSPAKVPARISLAHQAHLNELATALSAAQDAVASDPQSSSIGEIPTLIRESTTTTQRAHLATYLSTSDIYTDQFSAAQLVRSYPDLPRATLIQNRALIDDNGDLQFETAVDLLRDGVRAVAAPGQHVYAPNSTQQFRGLLNTAFETAIVDNTPRNATTTSEAISAQTIVLQAREEGIPLVVLSTNNLQTIDSLQIPANSRALVTRAVLEGRLVVIPTRAVRIGGQDRIGWYEIDKETAVTIGVLDDGSHGSRPIPPSRAYVPNEQAALRNGLIPILKQVAAGGVGFAAGVLASIGEHAILSYLKKLHLLSHEGMKAIEIGALLFTIHHVQEVFEILLESDPSLAPFWFGFTLGVTVGTTAQFHDPSVPPIYVDRNIGTALPTSGVATAEMSRTGSLPAGAISGNVSLNHALVSGNLGADWTTSSESNFDLESLEIGSAVVRDINSNIVGTGTVNLQTPTPVEARITGTKRFTAVGRGEFAVYANSTGNLDAGGSWEQAAIHVQSAGTVVITVDSQDVVLNGSRLPAGKYFLSTSSARFGGHGVFHSPNFTNSLSLNLQDGTVALGPSSSSLEIGGSTHSLPQGITFDNYTGSIEIEANAGPLDLAILGAAGAAIRLETSPIALMADQNTPVSLTIALESTLAGSFDVSAEAPAGWKVSLNTQTATLTVQPGAGVQSGLFPVRIVARSKTNSDLVAAADVTVSVNATLPGMALELAADPAFTVPFLGAHVPTSFEAQIRNLGPAADTYDITFSNPPAGFNILRSVNSLTVPAGETGFTGIYLEPNGVLRAPGTPVSFTVTSTSQSDPVITQTKTFTFQMPAVAAVTVEADPSAMSTIPGAPVTANVTIKNAGNMPYNLAIGASLPNGLTLSGLTTPVTLAVGQSTTQVVTLTPAANTPLNSTLTPTFTYGSAVAANQATVVQIDTGDAFVEAGQAVSVSADVFAGVLQAQQGTIVYVVKNAQGATVQTSAAISLALGNIAATQKVNLGTINTTGFTSGEYTIEASVRDANNAALPGALGIGKFVVGLPISAVQDASPNTVAEGLELTYVTHNATVESSVLVSLQPLVSIIDTNGTALNIALQGNVAYVAGTKEVTIVDLANPANPQIVGSFGAAQLSQDAFNVAQIVGGNLVIGSQSTVNANNSNIIVYSLASPLAPTLVSNTAVPYRFITDMLVQGPTAVIPTSGVSFYLPGSISGQFGDVVTVNLTNPVSPALADVLFNTNGSPNGGTTRQTGGTIVNGSLAYVGSSTFTGSNTTTGAGRVLIVNIANPSNISVAGEIQIPGVKQVLDIAIDGNRALVVGSSGGLRNPFNGFGDLGLDGTLTLTVLDVTSPNSPTILGTTLVTEAEFPSGTAPGLLQAVSLGGQHFAVSGVKVPQQGPVLVVVDATNPADIRARNLAAPAIINGLSVSGSYLHASSSAGLATYRISALIETDVQVSVQVPSGTGVDVDDDSFNIAPSQIIAGAGFDTLVWNLELGANRLSQELTWNSNLTGLTPGTTRAITLGATIDYGGTNSDLTLPAQIVAAKPTTQTLQLPVRVVVPGADAIAAASVSASQLGQTDLGNRLSDLATALTNLVQDPTSAVFHSQAVASLDAVIPLVGSDPFALALVSVLEANRATLAAASTPAEIQSALQALGNTLDALNDVLREELAHRFTFTLNPNSAFALPGAPTQFGLGLQNDGNQTTTYQLSVTGLPANVTSIFMQNGQPITTFTLDPGQADNGTVNGGIEAITLLLTETGGSLFPAGFTVTVTAVAAPQISLNQVGALTARNELIDVVSASANPAFTEPGPTVNISARVLSAVNTSRQARAFFTITNPQNAVIFTSAAVNFPLSVLSSLNTVALGAFNTAGLARGNYRIDVTVTDLANQPIPGATGQGSLQIGTPVGATLTVTPEQAPPGTSTVLNTLEVTRGLSIPDTLTFFGQVQTTPSATTVALYQNGAQRLAYVGGTNGVDIVDVTNPATPVKLSTFAGNLIVQGGFTGVRIHRIGNVDYLIVGSQVTSNGNRFTLLLYSLANPTSPALTNTPSGTPISHVFASDFLPSGNTIIVPTQGASGFFPRPITNQFGNVLSINISNPAAPVLSDVLYDSPGPPNSGTSRQPGGIIIDNQIAYVTSSTSSGGNLAVGTGRIFVMDFSNPAQLNKLRELLIPGTHHALTLGVQGNRALVVSSTGGLVDFVSPLAGNLVISMLDITDHANPQLIGTSLVVPNSSFPPPSAGVAKISVLPLSNGLFAVSEILVNGSPVLLLVDPSNPNNIVVTQTPTAHLLNEMAVSGNLLYTTSSDGLTIYEVFGSLTVSASVQVPSGTGVTIVPNTFSTPPTTIVPGPTFDTLTWQLSARTEAPTTITWQSTVANLQIDERRPVTLGATVNFTQQGTPGQLQLPETAVIGQHLISVSPEVRTARPGEAAAYVVTVRNPTTTPVTYDLSLAGVPAAWANLPTTVLVPAQGSVDVPLALTSATFAALSEYGFAVTAGLAGTARDSAPARLILSGAPVLDPAAHGVVAALSPTSATAGQGLPATYTLRVVNTGSGTDTFNLAATLPPGFTAAFEQTSVVVPPGASNFREITVQVTPALGTAAGNYPFSVTATSATLPSIAGTATANVNVVTAGVDVSLNPPAAPAGSVFQLTVRNTGTTTDTFSLALAGPGALVATLAQSSVTLAAGASTVVNISVAAIDFAVQPSLQLAAIATSQNNSAVKDLATADITIPLTSGVTSEFEEDTVTLAAPGPGTFLLLVDNLGNGEDAYEATIVGSTGPLSAALIGLDGSAVQTVPIFRLPGLSTGAIVLNVNLANIGQGTVTVQVRSLTNDSLISQSVATIRTTTTDFGDAPDTYGTTLTANGARHFTIGPQLGANRDPEVDGQPTASALGDDNASVPDDEDGVTLPGLLVAGSCDCSGTGLGNQIVVTASAAGYLDAWIDFNRNGRFDASEKIANSIPVAAGANPLNVTVPENASAGQTYARFRISSSGGLGPTGEARDGEVEDYAIQVFNPGLGTSGLIVDPSNAAANVLYIKGTELADAIVVRQTSSGVVTVYIAPTVSIGSYSLASFQKIVVCGLGGPDAIAVESPISKPTVLYGNDGPDAISGGSGPDIIFGGDSVDALAGNAGDDIISGGPGTNDSLVGGAGFDRLWEVVSGQVTLTNTNFKVGSDSNTISQFEAATLIGGNASDSFNIGGWPFPVTIDGGGGTNTIIDSGNGNFTLTTASLTRVIGTATRVATFTNIQNANLTGGSGNNVFNLTAWPLAATLSGAAGTDSFTVNGDVDYTLSDAMLLRPNLGLIRLSGFENATLTAGTSDNTFTVSGWTKAAALNGDAGTDKIVSAGNFNQTLSATSLVRTGLGSLTLASIEQAELFGGAGNNTLSAAAFNGQVKLDGGGGNDTLTSGAGLALILGGAGNDTLRAGTGRAVMIGGAGLDRLTGGTNDDLLISGQTAHDANAAALALLLAEWASTASYADRRAHLTGTPGGLNGGVRPDGANALHDTAVDVLLGGTGNDLFFAKLTNPAADSIGDKAANESAL